MSWREVSASPRSSSVERTPAVRSREALWGYAATFGAMWGAMEVTLGTFLHGLRVPLAGVVLATVAFALLVALRIVHPRRGVLLAAGIVCAGIKLLSPAGAVVGPMVAIIVEALWTEATVGTTGARRVVAAGAGALVAVLALVQKLVTQIVLYGLPVLSLYTGLLRRAEIWFGLTGYGWWIVGALVAAVASLGAVAGLAGVSIGQQARRRLARGWG